MSEPFLILAARIRQELAAIARTVAHAEQALTRALEQPSDRHFFLEAAALNLHDFYTGLERLWERIARTIDRSVPDGPAWHRELLQQMGLSVPDVRPAVLSETSIQQLEEYLAFRHVVRNIYAFEFDLERIARLVKALHSCFEQVQQDLLTFADWLGQMAQRMKGK